MIQVIVEKSAAKGLPEGWIKKLEITNRSGRKNRRDPVCTLYSLFFPAFLISDQKNILCLSTFSPTIHSQFLENLLCDSWKYLIWLLQFFIDPKSGYIFQSFKDALRYVETGDIGHYARKVKESYIEDDDSGNGKTVVSSFSLFVIVS